MRMKTMFKLLMTSLAIAGLLVTPVSAQEKAFDLGVSAYQIKVPGFIGEKDIIVNGETVHAIVAEKPVKKSNNRYDFFEIVTTDQNAVMVTSSAKTADGELGDLMGDLENGRIVYSPTLYDDFETVSDQPLYFGFSFRDKNFDTIYEFPIWFVFEAGTTAPSAPATAPTSVKEVTAKPTSSKVIVDGRQIAFEAYSINGNNYFKLRDLAKAVTGSEKQFEVTFDAGKKAINLVSGAAYTPVGNELAPGSGAASVKGITNQSKIYVDGKETEFEAYTINGNNYFKLRDVAAVFDFGVAWNGALNQIAIDTSAGYTE